MAMSPPPLPLAFLQRAVSSIRNAPVRNPDTCPLCLVCGGDTSGREQRDSTLRNSICHYRGGESSARNLSQDRADGRSVRICSRVLLGTRCETLLSKSADMFL